VVVAQGTEAGGHTGTVATLPLVPLIVDAIDGAIPVVAAGGIFDGRGLAAALALGADGVWVGTRFIATPEARTICRDTTNVSLKPARTARSFRAPSAAKR
jgi:NAD(P)H-dependent flavin oxidoreductase YrpB (nitropropane dioxygenase family)